MTAALALNGRRILGVVYGHVADTMAAIPALRTLRSAYPNARLEVLAIEASAQVLQPCPYVDEVVGWQDFKGKGTRLARVEKAATLAAVGWRIRRRDYDAVLIFHRSFRGIRQLAALSGATVRAGVSRGADGYTHWVPPPDGIYSSREENSRVLEALGIREDGGPLELWTTAEDEAAADRLLGSSDGRPRVGLHPGSDWSCQQWLPARFAAVGQALQAALGAQVVISGSASEVSLEREIASGLERPPVLTAGRTTLGELTAVVRRLDLLITVNSAPAAIAQAVGTPTVVLLGPEDARLTGLVSGARLGVVQPGLRFAPGSWCEFGRWGVLSGCDSPMCRAVSGLDQLTPEEVTTVAARVLETTRPTYKNNVRLTAT